MFPYQKFFDKVFSEWHIKQPSPPDFTTIKERGKICEKYVAKLINQCGYALYLPIEKSDPFDLYAIKYCDFFWHICLLRITERRIGTYNRERTKKIKVDYMNKFILIIKNIFTKSVMMKKYHDVPLLITGSTVIMDLYKDKYAIGPIIDHIVLSKGLTGKNKNVAIQKHHNIVLSLMLSKNIFPGKIINKLYDQKNGWQSRTYRGT
jgi:hypothetical protein